jgi:uncharacterized protein (DUF2384 family)
MMGTREGNELVKAFCLDVACAAPMERIDRVRRGIAPVWVSRLARAMRIADEHLVLYLGLDRRAMARRMAGGERLDPHDSEAIVATAKLLGDTFVALAAGGQAVQEVHIARQLGMWLRTPTPALDHQAPIQYLDVTEGRELVARLWIGRYTSAGHGKSVEPAA